MASSSLGSAVEDLRAEHIPMCKCGLKAQLCMSWSRDDVRRRFFRCSNYGSNWFCGFRCWYDAPTPQRLRVVIYGLVKKLDALQRISEVEEVVEKNRAVKKNRAVEMKNKNNKDEAVDETVAKLRKHNKRLKFIFVISWVIFILYIYG